jgi:large subunit ribosomal protein L21
VADYAIIKNGGKQYKVSAGDVLYLDRMSNENGENYENGTEIEFTEILAVSKDNKIEIGKPTVEGVKVKASIDKNDRAKKVVIYKKRRRKDSKLKRGFRRSYTKVTITEIA